MASPEDKEMKKQWITVDGRQTPIILPQIWDHDKEEWIVTGTNNPLPTQVTGSIVEYLTEKDLELISNETYKSDNFESNVNGIKVTLRTASVNDELEIMIEYRVSGWYTYRETLNTEEGINGLYRHYSTFLKTSDFRLSVENKGDVDTELSRVYVYGVM